MMVRTVARTLAGSAIQEASAATGNATELTLARREFSKAGIEIAAGRYDNGVERFKRAWVHAVKALRVT